MEDVFLFLGGVHSLLVVTLSNKMLGIKIFMGSVQLSFFGIFSIFVIVLDTTSTYFTNSLVFSQNL